MVDFIVDHKTAIILLITGAVISAVFKSIIESSLKYLKIGLIKICKLIKSAIGFIIRRIKGQYNSDDLKRIARKPENKRSKKEQKALEEDKQIKNELVKTLFTIHGVPMKK